MIPETKIVLMGRSLGGALAIEIAAEAPARALVVESCFSSLGDAARYHYPSLAWLVPPAKLDASTRISSFDGPLLQSHGQADRIVPFELGRKLFLAANEPKQFVPIPDGTHNDAPSAAYYEQLKQFLAGLNR